jgi:tRNA (adenine22-N1)-methyltransferase
VAWADRLAYRAGDGLAAVRPQDAVDTIVISGLGARAMVRILSGPPEAALAARRLVLQPRTDAALVRRWLSARGWRPVSERLTEDRGAPHVTIAAERGDDGALYRHPALDRSDLLVAGPLLVRSASPALDRLWRAQRARLAAIVRNGTTGAGRLRACAELARAERILAVISRRGG